MIRPLIKKSNKRPDDLWVFNSFKFPFWFSRILTLKGKNINTLLKCQKYRFKSFGSFNKLLERRSFFHQFLILSLLNQLSFLKQENIVWVFNRFNAMGDANHCLSLQLSVDILLHFSLCFPVQRRCALIKQEYLRLPQQCPSNCSPLLLSSRYLWTLHSNLLLQKICYLLLETCVLWPSVFDVVGTSQLTYLENIFLCKIEHVGDDVLS